MSPDVITCPKTIQRVLAEFAEARRTTLDDEDYLAYRRVLFFLELCINNYGHRNLETSERALYERLFRAHGLDQRHFFEIFGPLKLLPELDFFGQVYVKNEVFTSERIEQKAPLVTDDLAAWLVERGDVTAGDVARAHSVATKRRALRVRAVRVAKLLARRTVAVDPLFFAESDYIAADDHPITRIDPGRFWLRVYRTGEPEDFGPFLAPVAATKSLDVGWTLCCALARVRGRWQLTGVDEVYPCVS